MPQSLALVVVHIVFSTKDRRAFLEHPIRHDLHAYLATRARIAGCECYCVGGVSDHVHLAVRLSRTVTIAKLLEDLKTSSSKWLKTQSPSLKAFAWQGGYGAFSVGPSDLPALRRNIETQEDHHKKYSFQDELRALLTKYGVEHDELYMWE
jgi:REP element-mobilizing transposase RayT